MSTKPKIAWNKADFYWNAAPSSPSYKRYTWNDVKLLTAAGGPSQGDFGAEQKWIKWDKKKKNKLVELILKVQGNTITESKRKEIKQYKIKASDIKLTLEKILDIEVITENIKL